MSNLSAVYCASPFVKGDDETNSTATDKIAKSDTDGASDTELSVKNVPSNVSEVHFTGAIYDMLRKLDLVHPETLEFVQKGVRGNPDTEVYLDSISGVFFLKSAELVDEESYRSKKAFEYWGAQDVAAARKKCYDDDSRRCDYVRKLFNAESSSLLDVGFGCGGFLHLTKEHFKSVSGMDLQPDVVELLKKENFDVTATLPDRKFDVVTLWHVFEHLHDPVETLWEIKQVLAPGGRLVIEVPHARDLLLTKLDCEAFRQFTFWDQHLLLHTKESLAKFLEEAGFKVEKVHGVQRYPVLNHLSWMSTGQPGGQNKPENQHLRSRAFEAVYEQLLMESDNTDTLIAVATH